MNSAIAETFSFACYSNDWFSQENKKERRKETKNNLKMASSKYKMRNMFKIERQYLPLFL